jgi:hypothetical protein
MKMKSVFIVAIVLGGFYLSSCEKESSVERGAIEPGVTNLVGDSNYLDKVYLMDTLNNILDTTHIITLHYDNQKRVISMCDTVVGNSIYENGKRFYYYNGVDSLPKGTFEIARQDPNTNLLDSIIAYFTYDGSQRKIKDSIIYKYPGMSNGVIVYATQQEVYKYYYTIGGMYGTRRYELIYPSQDTFYYKDTAILNSNGNIVSSKGYQFVNTGGGNGYYELRSKTAYMYDGKLNPFAYTKMYKAHQEWPSGETLFFEYMGNQNITTQNEIIYSSPGGTNINYDADNTYIYNSHGLPIVEKDLQTGTKILFKYKFL